MLLFCKEFWKILLYISFPRSVSNKFGFISEPIRIFSKESFIVSAFSFFTWIIQPILRNCWLLPKHIYNLNFFQDRNLLNLICPNSKYHRYGKYSFVCEIILFGWFRIKLIYKSFICFLSHLSLSMFLIL